MIRLLNKPRVLLLDDDPSMQRLIATLLRREGFRVDCVSTGRQAIDKIKKADYGVLLLDIMTPTEGGMTVIRHLQKNDASLLDRVVLVTASPLSVLRSLTKLVYAVIRKPFQPEELIATVRRLTT